MPRRGVGMSESGYLARCWRCGWESPYVESEESAELFAGWHAIAAGCAIGEVRTLKTSEVTA